MLGVHCRSPLPRLSILLYDVALYWDLPTIIVVELGSFRGALEC